MNNNGSTVNLEYRNSANDCGIHNSSFAKVFMILFSYVAGLGGAAISETYQRWSFNQKSVLFGFNLVCVVSVRGFKP